MTAQSLAHVFFFFSGYESCFFSDGLGLTPRGDVLYDGSCQRIVFSSHSPPSVAAETSEVNVNVPNGVHIIIIIIIITIHMIKLK